MPDVKISALPASTTPLAGTEVLPIVQSSTTRQVSVANLTAGRAVSALSIATTTGATFATTSGNVGIGTSSPAQPLQIGDGTSAGYQVVRVLGTNCDLFMGQVPATRFGLSSGTYTTMYNDANQALAIGTIAAYPLVFGTSNAERMRIDSSGNVGIGNTNPSSFNAGARNLVVGSGSGGQGISIYASTDASLFFAKGTGGSDAYVGFIRYYFSTDAMGFNVAGGSEKMRIDSSGNLLVGKTVNDTTTNGCNISAAGRGSFSSNGQAVGDYNRTGDDGVLVNFLQDGTIEGTISVSGSTVSYNGGHLSRWSQWQNQSGQPNIYRGTVLESTNDMCEWGQTNEQSTKTIVSTTAKSKAVAGVFDMYDFDDKTNPNDFYVAQSGDFVIRIAQGVVVENGDLLESAGDGTARPQTDDICRSSTIAKVTSNYVSTTYADGSFCVPCILMIG